MKEQYVAVENHNGSITLYLFKSPRKIDIEEVKAYFEEKGMYNKYRDTVTLTDEPETIQL